MNDSLLNPIFSYYQEITSGDLEQIVCLLKEVQDIYGYIPSIAKDKLAKLIGVKPSFIDAIIKRYPTLKNQAISNTITVCTGERCIKKNSLALLQKIERLLNVTAGESTTDGKFELKTKMCMKRCSTCVNMTINDTHFASVSVDTIQTILAPYL